MRTIHVGLSHASIKENQTDLTTHQLRDTKLPIYFRSHSSNRDLGTFYLVLNKKGKTHWIKLGVYPALSPSSARVQAKKLLSESANKTAVPSQLEFINVAELLSWYLQRIKENKALSPHSKQNQTIAIQRHLLPLLGKTSIEEVCLPLIERLLYQPLQKVLALSTLENILAVLNAAFKRATKVQLIRYNPLLNCSLAEFTHQRPKVKVTRLTHKALLSRLKTLKNERDSHQMLFFLLVVHATRIGETVAAKWEHFDFEEKLWRIPAANTKNKKPHTLPLTDFVITWLKSYKKYQNKNQRSAYLFPHKSNSRLHISANQGSSIISKLANKQWSAHDLRKFARSAWLEAGVDYMIGEFLLNHTLSKLDQTYIQTIAMQNCRDALSVWSDWLVERGLD
ncbi:MAG: tyrosine-type recombinase/integrase [Thalassotalea sp.]